MKIGLYFGSFNPIHIGHLIIAKYIVENTDIEQVWFVVSPQNPFKSSKSLLNEYHRLHLINMAIEGEKKMKTCNIEFNLPKPSYTINTLAYLEEKFPGNNFVIIMGSDSFSNLHKWKNFETIVKNYSIYIYRRKDFDILNKVNAKIKILEAPQIEISSTEIRQYIKKGKSIRFFVPDIVKEEIEKGHYYK